MSTVKWKFPGIAGELFKGFIRAGAQRHMIRRRARTFPPAVFAARVKGRRPSPRRAALAVPISSKEPEFPGMWTGRAAFWTGGNPSAKSPSLPVVQKPAGVGD